jgi:hypothetical protein
MTSITDVLALHVHFTSSYCNHLQFYSSSSHEKTCTFSLINHSFRCSRERSREHT